MKLRLFILFTVLAFVCGIGLGIVTGDYVPLVHSDGPDKMVVESGGEIEVLSGATLDLQSGSTFNVAGSAFSATEFGYLDGVTAGTAAASKAVVLDASLDNSGARNITVTGTLQGANVTATATVQGEQVTSTDDITATDNITGASFINTDNVGTANTGVTVVEYGDGYAHHTVMTVSQSDAVTVADNAALCDGYLLYTFPAGEIIIENVSVSMATTLAEDSANAAAEACVGNVIGSDAQATCGADDAGLENFLGPITTADMSGTPDVLTVATGAGTPVVLATADPHLLHWNICSTWNDTAGADLTGDIAGTVVVDWKFMQ